MMRLSGDMLTVSNGAKFFLERMCVCVSWKIKPSIRGCTISIIIFYFWKRHTSILKWPPSSRRTCSLACSFRRLKFFFFLKKRRKCQYFSSSKNTTNTTNTQTCRSLSSWSLYQLRDLLAGGCECWIRFASLSHTHCVKHYLFFFLLCICVCLCLSCSLVSWVICVVCDACPFPFKYWRNIVF